MNATLIRNLNYLLSERERKIRNQVLIEMNDKFKDLKAKMLKKINAKNEEIQTYNTFLENLCKKLGNIDHN